MENQNEQILSMLDKEVPKMSKQQEVDYQLGLPSEVSEFILSVGGEERKVVLETIYSNIGDMVNSEYFNLDISMSEVDSDIGGIINKQDTLNTEIMLSLNGYMLRLANKALDMVGIELKPLEELSLTIVSDIVRVVNMLPYLELGLEGEVLSVCESMYSDNCDIVFEYSKLLSSYGTHSVMEYYDCIEEVSDGYLTKLRKYLDSKSLEPDEEEAIDTADFIAKINFKYNVFKEKVNLETNEVVAKPLIATIDPKLIEELIRKQLLFKSVTDLYPVFESFITKNIDAGSVGLTFPYLVLLVVCSGDGQRLASFEDYRKFLSDENIGGLLRLDEITVDSNARYAEGGTSNDEAVKRVIESQTLDSVAKELVNIRRM